MKTEQETEELQSDDVKVLVLEQGRINVRRKWGLSDEVKVLVLEQGDAVCGAMGYGLKRSENVVAFWLDGWGETGRIYCCSYCNSSWIDGKIVNTPELTIEDGRDDSSVSRITFPEYEGWRVHCIGGGKTMGICLVKD